MDKPIAELTDEELRREAMEWKPSEYPKFLQDCAARGLTEADALTKPGFKLVRAGTLPVKKPEWLIHGLLELDSLALLFGDPNSCKTFLALDWACRIASGLPFQDAKVRQGAVVYIAGEGGNGLARRRRAWELYNKKDLGQLPLYFSIRPTMILDRKIFNDTLQAIEKLEDPPLLVVFDTLSRNFGGGDENSTKDMNSVIQAADTLRTRFGCTVLFLHHSGHSNKDRSRGAIALKAAMDAEYRLDRDNRGVVRLLPVRMKDAELGNPLAFELATVRLGIQDEDEEIQSAVLEPVEYQAPAESARTGKWEKIGLEILQEEPLRVEAWRKKCMAAGMPRTRAYQILSALKRKKLVTESAGYVSVVE